MVYFDFLGYAFIAYTESTGQILHIIIPILSVVLSFYFLHIKGISRRYLRKELRYGFFVTIFSIFLGCVVCYLIANELDFNGKSMSWYNRTYFSVALYCLPSLAVSAFFYAQLVRTRDTPLSLALQAQARLNGVNLMWALGSIILTLMGFRVGYVLMMPVLVSLIVNTIIGLTKSQNTSRASDQQQQFRLNKVATIYDMICFFFFLLLLHSKKMVVHSFGWTSCCCFMGMPLLSFNHGRIHSNCWALRW